MKLILISFILLLTLNFAEGNYAFSFSFNGSNFYRGKIFFAVWNAVFQKPVSFPSFALLNLPADKLSRFEGIYRTTANKETATIKFENGVLNFKFSNMKNTIPITPIDELNFINNEFGRTLNEFGRTLEFRENADKSILSFRHFYGRGESVWTKSK